MRCLACRQGRCEDCWTLGLDCECCLAPAKQDEDEDDDEQDGVDDEQSLSHAPESHALPWDHPDADPVGDIRRVVADMRKAAYVQHHSFNAEGRCVICDIRWAHAVGTVCDNEKYKEAT